MKQRTAVSAYIIERGRAVAHMKRLARWLAPWWWIVLLVSIALLLTMWLLTHRYGDAQTAADASDFRSIVATDGRSRFIAAAVVDLLFAASYGLLALALAPIVRSWPGDLRRVGTIGCALVILGALLDEVENILLLLNLGNLSGVDDSAIERMNAVGQTKWAVALVGAVLVVGVLLSRALWRTSSRDHMRRWVERSWLPYGCYVGLVIAFVGAAAAQQRWSFWLLVPALAVCGSWLNDTVWRSRTAHRDDHEPDLGPPRLLFAIIQLAIAASLIAVGNPDVGNLGDTAIFLGIALVIMSLGALVSELRQNGRQPGWRSAALVAVATGLLVAAAIVDSGRMIVLLVVMAAITGEVATELATEDYQRHVKEPDKQWRLSAIGGGVVILGFIVLVGLGVDWVHAVALVVALGVIVWMASVDGAAVVIVLLLALALVASTRPGERDVEDDVEAVAGEPYILVLGDSYTSGEGATDYIPGTNKIVRTHSANDQHTNECRQAPTAWPFVLAERIADDGPPSTDDSAFPTRVLFLACSGAVTENIDAAPRLDEHGVQHGPAELALYLEREPELGPPALVIVGIGGNDGGFGDLGSTCVGPGNCAEVAEQFFRNRPDRQPPPPEGNSEALSDITDDLHGAYERIRDTVGDGVPIVTTAYPLPITTEGRCAGTLLEAEERLFINGFAEQLNNTIRQVAADEEVIFMDIAAALSDEGAQLCTSGAGLNFLAFGSKGGTIRDSLSPENWAHNSLHPNARGHEVLGNAAYQWFSDNWPVTDPGDAAVVPERSVDEILTDLGVEQCRPAERPACSIDGSIWSTAEATFLYRRSVVPLAVTTIALWMALLPLVATGRATWSLLSILQHIFDKPWRGLTKWWQSI